MYFPVQHIPGLIFHWCVTFGETHVQAIIKNHSDLAYSYKRNFLLTARDIELYRIAGLIQDIGHGPYSHLHMITLSMKESAYEERGVIIFKHMVAKYKLP